jgi:Ca-activated chloride channel homolog
MSFQWPLALAGLALVPLAFLLYGAVQRRRQRYAVRFTNLDLLANVVAAQPGWRRHVPPFLYLLSLIALVIALARPEATIDVPQEEASAVLTTDVSGSMQATDVEPNRLVAAQNAARRFVEDLPEEARVGIVAFSGGADTLTRPTTDRIAIESAIASLSPGGGTAMGDGIMESIDAVRELVEGSANGADPGGDTPGGAAPCGGETGGEPAEAPPAAIILLSDGANTTGRTDPIQAAEAAADLGIPVHTIALGTDEGTIELPDSSGFTRQIPVPPDRETLQEVSDMTGGRYFDAPDAAELEAIYDDLGTRIGTQEEQVEVTYGFAGGGLALLALGGLLSLLWFSRVP